MLFFSFPKDLSTQKVKAGGTFSGFHDYVFHSAYQATVQWIAAKKNFLALLPTDSVLVVKLLSHCIEAFFDFSFLLSKLHGYLQSYPKYPHGDPKVPVYYIWCTLHDDRYVSHRSSDTLGPKSLFTDQKMKVVQVCSGIWVYTGWLQNNALPSLVSSSVGG